MGEPTPGLQQIETTSDKLRLHLPGAGALASEYEVADRQIYVGRQPSQFYFAIEGLGIIRHQGNVGLEGTYQVQP